MPELQDVGGDDITKVVARVANPIEIVYLEMGQDIYKKTPQALGDAIKSLSTITVSVLGGSIAFLSDSMVTGPAKVVAVTAFLVGLSALLIGITPAEAYLSWNDPNDVCDFVKATNRRKSTVVSIAAFCLIGGFVAIVIGMAFRTLG